MENKVKKTPGIVTKVKSGISGIGSFISSLIVGEDEVSDYSAWLEDASQQSIDFFQDNEESKIEFPGNRE